VAAGSPLGAGSTRSPVVRRRPTAAGPHAGPRIEVAFHSILIPVTTERRRVPPAMTDVAAGLCAERGARIVLLAFTRIPLAEEMDVELPEVEARIERLAAQARALGDGYGMRVELAHLRTRDPAESILAEAHRRRSEVVLLGATARPGPVHAGLSRDPVARRVAAEARVRVMIVQPAPNRPLPAAWAEPADERGAEPDVAARAAAAAVAPLVEGGWPRLIGRPRA
jgi:Universal stress protein family